MEIKIETSKGIPESTELLVVLVDTEHAKRMVGSTKSTASWARLLDDTVLDLIRRTALKRKFSGTAKQVLSLSVPYGKSALDVLVLGLGKVEKSELAKLSLSRQVGAEIVDHARRLNIGAVSVVVDSQSVRVAGGEDRFLRGLGDGLRLGAYRFDKYKSKVAKAAGKSRSSIREGTDRPLQICILSPSASRARSTQLDESASFCEGTILARDLVNLPAKDCTPQVLVDAAKRLAKEHKLGLEILNKDKLERIGAHALLAVAQGSEEPPYLIRLTYKPKRATKKCISLVGKGVTFDSGGYSLKTASGMESMKIDMSGAAAVLGAISILASLGSSQEVRVYIPTVENMVSGRAIRPGDVVSGILGKSIEILNTDAEGRLILSDAIALAEREKCSQIIDVATLTGACMVALGMEYAGLFTDSEVMATKLQQAARAEGEQLWRLPLAAEYQDLIKSSVADIKNTGGPYGGAITAALFLKEFVGSTPWAHLDIAGPANSDKDRGWVRKGGTGFATRTLARYVLDL